MSSKQIHDLRKYGRPRKGITMIAKMLLGTVSSKIGWMSSKIAALGQGMHASSNFQVENIEFVADEISDFKACPRRFRFEGKMVSAITCQY